jgi:phosphomannomutase
MKFETLRDMIAIIKKNKLYGGVAFDGDGDRAFLVDETGVVLSGGVILSMLAEHFLKTDPGASIIYDLRISHSVPDLITSLGGKPVRTKVGHATIKHIMRDTDAPFGGEASGHFYFRDNWYADSGLLAAVIALYVATLSGQKLSAIRQKYTRYASIPETNITVSDKEAALQHLAETFKDKSQDTLDGLTVTLNETNWFNVRPSNTEPVLRLNAEAKTQAELDTLVAKVTGLIETH